MRGAFHFSFFSGESICSDLQVPIFEDTFCKKNDQSIGSEGEVEWVILNGD